MDSYVTKIIFDKLFFKHRNYLKKKRYLRLKNDNYPFNEIIKDNVKYSLFYLKNPFTKEKLFSNDDPHFYLNTNEVYNLIDSNPISYGGTVFHFLKTGNNTILEREINNRKHEVELYKSKNTNESQIIKKEYFFTKIFSKKKEISSPFSHEELEKKIWHNKQRDEEDNSMMFSVSENYFKEFITNTKSLNDRHFSPTPLDKKYNFIIMINIDDYDKRNELFDDILVNYNDSNNTNFEVIEYKEYDGFEFAVISVSIATYEDLFYLGFYLSYKQNSLNELRQRQLESIRFKRDKVLLEKDIYENINKIICSSKSKNYQSSFSLKKEQLNYRKFTTIYFNYEEGERLTFKNGKLFDMYSNPQVFNLKTTGKIYNFINKSPFKAGLKIGYYLSELGKLNLKYILEIKQLNAKFNTTIKLDNTFNFVLMTNEDLISKAISFYDKNFNVNFKIKETFNLDGEQFCIVNISNGNIIDIFCLGICMLLQQVKL
ncbi:hypothetical protein JL193_00075 [Polaribacter batillariae]|uniref:Tubby C-terminal domain-containing protein n=1 Tax=Polaribacter batillariae TaxID=2808900 RepID=A0ABX7SU28_9FLAO|nr:hypothetical protein [Polaribacter batillariae]QTD37749.1 hypothetical protein JL193_00075 [Polaribacter batillariae]